MATATLFGPNQTNNPERIGRGIDGAWSGQRHFVVDSQDVLEVFLATGMPNYGDSWSGTITAPIVVFREIYEWIGDHSCRVRVDYASNASGTIVPGGIGNDWTEVVSQPSTFQAFSGVGADATTRIANGQGVSKEIFQIELRVHAYVTAANFPSLFGRVIDLADGFVNSQPISTPRLMGSGLSLNFSAGQLRYVGFEVPGQFDDGVLEMIHVLAARPNHLAFWRDEEPDGGIGIEQSAVIYQETTFAGLWS